MPSGINEYRALRVYRRYSLFQIINAMVCNRAMTSKVLVANSAALYKISRRVFTPYFTDFILKNTFCKTLTAGTTLDQANKASEYFRAQKISIILDYCAEGDIHETDDDKLNDENAEMFRKSAELLSQNQNQMISIKITGLIKMKLLNSLNSAVQTRDQIWKKHSTDGYLHGLELFDCLKNMSKNLTQNVFCKYLKEIHNYEGKISEFIIDEVGFKMNHYPFYLQDDMKNQNQVINILFPKSQSDKKNLMKATKRIFHICDPFVENKKSFKILVDAEQSYVQKGIQIISEQLQHKFNKRRLYILPTIQNYLKRSVERSKYQIEIAKRRDLMFGAKLVRGAYLVEESKLAEKNKTENPIVSCFEQTTQNYMKSFELMIASFTKGQIIVATHNSQTINDTSQMAINMNTRVRVSYAQLLGLADHLTYKTNAQGYRVYKYLPWASTKTMIPYMIRRAEQLSQMKYPLTDQYILLKQELRNRFSQKQ